jgi:hypothetical protein
LFHEVKGEISNEVELEIEHTKEKVGYKLDKAR